MGTAERFVAPRVTVLSSPATTSAGSNDFVAATWMSFWSRVRVAEASSVAVTEPTPTSDRTVLATTKPSLWVCARSVSARSSATEAVAPAGIAPANVTRAPRTSDGSVAPGSTPPGTATQVPPTKTSYKGAPVAPAGGVSAPKPENPR